MPKFAANLSFIFQEVGFLDRFAAAAACGFKAVEYLSPFDHPPEVIAEQLNRHGLEQALFNMPPGDWAAGERGIGALPGREQEFRDGVQTALVYARATRCRILHAMAGVSPAGQDRAQAERTYLANLQHAADRLAAEGLTLVIEPINTRDIPGYFLNTTTQAMSPVTNLSLGCSGSGRAEGALSNSTSSSISRRSRRRSATRRPRKPPPPVMTTRTAQPPMP